MGTSYSQIFEALPRQAGRDQQTRHRIVHEEMRRVESQGYRKAVVINLHPFPLRVSLGDLGRYECPAASGAAPGRLVLRTFRFSMGDHGDGDYRPVPVFPPDIAAQFTREFGRMGGVIALEGEDAQPSAEQLQAAQEARLAWLRGEVKKAADAWSRFRQHRFIDDHQRGAARELHSRGELSALPEWATAGMQSDTKPCPECAETIKAAAIKCRHCGWRLAPAEEPNAEDAPRERKRK